MAKLTVALTVTLAPSTACQNVTDRRDHCHFVSERTSSAWNASSAAPGGPPAAAGRSGAPPPYVSREVLDACVSPGVHERGALKSVIYAGFVDPSGGRSDSMTLAI